MLFGWCKENKLICVLEAHDATGSDKVEDVVAAAKYWAENKDILNKNADYVILNIANEWVGTWDSATWAKGSSEAIKVVRDAGIKNMIMIDSAGWGQYGASIKEKVQKYSHPILTRTLYSRSISTAQQARMPRLSRRILTAHLQAAHLYLQANSVTLTVMAMWMRSH